MEVKCPHCQHSFSVQLRKGNYTNAKANQARRANSKLGGRPSKITDATLEEIYLAMVQEGSCSGERFSEAIRKATGIEYSRSRVFHLLKNFKANVKKTPLEKWLGEQGASVPAPGKSLGDRTNFSNDKTTKPSVKISANQEKICS